jgi:GDP-L-fucose synthase
MSLNHKTVFVAGAAGMTGASILRVLLQRYPETRIKAGIFHTEPALTSERITYVRGDLRDLQVCRRMVRGCDCVIMAAARTGGAAYTTRSPFEHTRENLWMNWQMLEAVRLEAVPRLVFIGSAVIYQPVEGFVREDELDHNADPHMAYFGLAQALRFLETMCRFLHEQYGHAVVMVRAANIFGPRDKFDPARSNFIPAIVRKAVDRQEPFELWGSPDVTRDVIYCDDFARAVTLLADAPEITCDVFNVGSGRRTTVGQVADWALQYADHAPREIRWVQDRPTTLAFRGLDIHKLQRAVNWAPACRTEQGVARTVSWWREHREGWRR